MVPIAVFVSIGLILFFAAFFSRRRFGLLGLSLTAGAMLSNLWSYDAGLVISTLGILPNGSLTQAVSQSAVVLLPALLLLFHGSTYHNVFARIIGSLLFALLALAFLIGPLEYILPLVGQGADIYDLFKQYKDVVISVGVVLAILDLFFTKPAAFGHHEKKH